MNFIFDLTANIHSVLINRLRLLKRTYAQRLARFCVKGLFHCAENRQSGPSRFFREVGGADEYLCRARCAWRNNQYILAAETDIANEACAAAAFIYLSSSSASIIFVC